MFLFTTTVLVVFASQLGRAQHFSQAAFQMAIHNGFSPFHPARINHETLPISQAEFAQLVAESMATSHGPHHHHPPNTDANYESDEHLAHDAEMLRSASEGHYGHYHRPHHYAHPYGAKRHYDSPYRSEEKYREEEHPNHPRSAVYASRQNDAEVEEDDFDEPPPRDDHYGGRPGTSHYREESPYSKEYVSSSYEQADDNLQGRFLAAASQTIPIQINLSQK